MGTSVPVVFPQRRQREAGPLFLPMSNPEIIMKVRKVKHTLRVIRRRVRKVGTPMFRQVRI